MLHLRTLMGQFSSVIKSRWAKRVGITGGAAISALGLTVLTAEFFGRNNPVRIFANNSPAVARKLFPQQQQEIEKAVQATHPSLDPKKATKVISVLADIEKKNVGPFESYTAPNTLGFRGSSTGPLQVKASRGGMVYRQHYGALKDCLFFQDEDGAPSRDEITQFIKNREHEKLNQLLRIDGFGGVTLGLIHFLDLYESRRRECETALTDPQLLEVCASTNSFLQSISIMDPDVIREVRRRFLQTGTSPNAIVPSSLAFVGYATSDHACAVASLQGLLNDWLWATKDSETQRLAISGSYTKATEELLNRYFTSFNRSPISLSLRATESDPIKAKLQTETVVSLLTSARSFWFSGSKSAQAPVEAFNERLRSALMNPEESICASELKLLFDSPTRERACYDIALMRTLEEVLQEDSGPLDRSSCSSMLTECDLRYRKYIDTRNPAFHELMDLDYYNTHIKPICGVTYQDFAKRFMHQVMPVWIGEHFAGAVPTYYEDLGVGGTKNAFSRAILGTHQMLGWREPGK